MVSCITCVGLRVGNHGNPFAIHGEVNMIMRWIMEAGDLVMLRLAQGSLSTENAENALQELWALDDERTR